MNYTPPVPTLVVTGMASNVGKTTVMVALAQRLQDAGYTVACFKCGPDYLDPSYHARASGLPSYNLDSWLMDKDALVESFDREVRRSNADIALVEGVMGLFDGADAASDQGSAAEIARWLNAALLLVIDASGMARSFAAVAAAIASANPDLRFAGALANRVGSVRHLALLHDAVASFPELGDWLIAGLPKSAAIGFPSRHLGLVSARDSAATAESFAALKELGKAWLCADTVMNRLRAIAPTAPRLRVAVAPKPLDPAPVTHEAPVRIAIAEDEAFHFYYPYNRQLLERFGAVLVPFSPLAAPALPDCDALWLGGGYPELFAERLSQNTALHEDIRRHDAKGLPIFAECGGFMYLCQQIATLDGESFGMVGLVPGKVTMAEKLIGLGYVTASLDRDSILGPKGLSLKGHQFRYSDCEMLPHDEGAWQMTRKRTGQTTSQGFVSANVVASYVHVHFASKPEAAAHFVAAARRFRKQATGALRANDQQQPKAPSPKEQRL